MLVLVLNRLLSVLSESRTSSWPSCPRFPGLLPGVPSSSTPKAFLSVHTPVRAGRAAVNASGCKSPILKMLIITPGKGLNLSRP